MDDLLISLLETLADDVIKQGTLDVEEYPPNTFFTYFNWQNPRDKYYDNKHRSVVYYYQIQFYSKDIKVVDDILVRTIELLESNGFNIEEEPIDSYSDLQNYTCKSFEVNIEKRRIES